MRLSRIIAAIAIAVSLTAAAFGQTSSNPATSFLGSVGDYFTSFNTNQPIRHADGIQAWTGADYQNGLNFAQEIGVSKAWGNVSNAFAFTTEGVVRDAGIGGILVDGNFGPGIAYYHFDTQVSAGVDGGYNFSESKPDVEIYGDVRKSLSANTWAGMRLAYVKVIGDKGPDYPVVALTAGFGF
jgi:hypothetical protein